MRSHRTENVIIIFTAALLQGAPSCADQQASRPSPVVLVDAPPPPPELTISPAPSQAPEALQFTMNKSCEAPPRRVCPVRVIGVRLTKTETIVTVRHDATGLNVGVRIWPPDSPLAFYLTTAKGARSRLLRVDGVPVAPAVLTPEPGVVTDFTLTFERIPAGTTVFDMLEGQAEPNARPFRFIGVTLDAPVAGDLGDLDASSVEAAGCKGVSAPAR